MKTLNFLLIVTLVSFTTNLYSDNDADQMSSAEQRALQAELEHSLVAPCCWNMTVDQHESPASHQVRDKISELIKAGKTQQEILDYFSSQPQYGERILATPSQKNLLGKLAYWLIPMAFVFGIFVVTKTIRSVTGNKTKKSSPSTGKKTQIPHEESKWEKQVEEDLEDFD